MAAIGCFAALATGTAYAANTIGSADIIDESIVSADLKNYGVKRADIGLNSINSDRVEDDTLTGADIREASLGTVPSAASAASAGSAPGSGRQVVSSALVQNHTGQRNFGSVECPAGKLPSGGGVHGLLGTVGQNVSTSYPSGDNWHVWVTNSSASASSFRVYAVCVDVPVTAAAAADPAEPSKKGS